MLSYVIPVTLSNIIYSCNWEEGVGMGVGGMGVGGMDVSGVGSKTSSFQFPHFQLLLKNGHKVIS